MKKMNSKQDANFANSSEDSMKGEGIKTHYIALPPPSFIFKPQTGKASH